MRFKDIFQLSTRMFVAHTSRTLLTILGMSIGVGAILFLVSFGYGLQRALLERITTSDALSTLDVMRSAPDGAVIDDGVVKHIIELPGVRAVYPAREFSAQGTVDALTTDLAATVTIPAFLHLANVTVEAGDLLRDAASKDVVMTNAAARIFTQYEPARIIGKDVQVMFFLAEDSGRSVDSTRTRIAEPMTYRVGGIVKGEEPRMYVYDGSLSTFALGPYSHLKVQASSADVLPQLRERIIAKGFEVSALSDTIDEANKIFHIIQVILMLFGVIALVVSAIGMFNTMTITLLERTEEIGIMKSIGASDAIIAALFIMESTLMGFLGGVGGLVIGSIGGELFNILVNLLAVRLGGQSVDLFYSPLWVIALIIIFGAGVGLLTGIAPARRASRIDPLDALRYK